MLGCMAPLVMLQNGDLQHHMQSMFNPCLKTLVFLSYLFVQFEMLVLGQARAIVFSTVSCKDQG